jgi:hypothetical protein
MSVSIHFSDLLIEGVKAERNSRRPGLVSVTVIEGQDGQCADTRLTANEPHWQTIVDRLAEIGIVAKGVAR